MKKLLLLLLFTFPIIGLSQSSAYDKAENYFTEKIPNANTMLIALYAEDYSINSDKFKDYNNIKDVFSENDFSVNDEIIFYDSIFRFRNSIHQPTNPTSNGFSLTVVTKLNYNDSSEFFHLYLESDLAYLNITKGILIAKHNVKYTYNNKTLITEQLIWDMNTNKIHTSELIHADDFTVISGSSFKGIFDFSEFEIPKALGVVGGFGEIDEKEEEFILACNELILEIKTNIALKNEVKLNNGRKIICLFDAGSFHCQDVAKELYQLSNEIENFPKIHIVFSDISVDKIPEFFDVTEIEASYQTIENYNEDDEVNSFVELLLTTDIFMDYPVIIYLYNGVKICVYEGDGNRRFNYTNFKDIVKRILLIKKK